MNQVQALTAKDLAGLGNSAVGKKKEIKKQRKKERNKETKKDTKKEKDVPKIEDKWILGKKIYTMYSLISGC